MLIASQVTEVRIFVIFLELKIKWETKSLRLRTTERRMHALFRLDVSWGPDGLDGFINKNIRLAYFKTF